MIEAVPHTTLVTDPIPFRIEAVTPELSDCFTISLQPIVKRKSFTFAPGQFNMLYAFGHGEVPISMSGHPADAERLVHTIRNVGSVTAALQKLKIGDMMGVRGPFGSSWPLETAKGKNILIMAGGLGLAPMRSAIYYLLANRPDYGTISLLYGTRDPSSILFASELKKWSQSISVSLTVDSATPDWKGQVGVVTDLLSQQDSFQNTLALVCGPEIMMRFSAYALLDYGLTPADIYVSMERNMKCALGFCGRCQYGPYFVCHDGPVFSFDRVERLFKIREV